MPFWLQFTRLGEAQILLPAALGAMAALVWQAPGRRLSARWLAALALATLLTTATKVAFIGWGWGWPELDFTGISGHAMFAAAVLPPLAAMLMPSGRAGLRAGALAGGGLLALAVGVSRVVVQAHSASEVLAGLALGATVSGLALAHAGRTGAAVQLWAPLRVWAPAGLAVWLVLSPVHAPASQTQALVTRLALSLSGHERPHTRAELLRPLHRPSAGAPRVQSAPAVAATTSGVVSGPRPLKRSSSR
jgi:membrane-associated phospholipid phosphatase